MILEELRRNKTHPTADELYESVRRRLPRISLGTVYRNLELLSRCGEIRKLEQSGSQMRFDGDLTDHHHIRCEKCGKIRDIRGLPVCDICEQKHLEDTGYRLITTRVELIGLCPECQGAEE